MAETRWLELFKHPLVLLLVGSMLTWGLIERWRVGQARQFEITRLLVQDMMDDAQKLRRVQERMVASTRAVGFAAGLYESAVTRSAPEAERTRLKERLEGDLRTMGDGYAANEVAVRSAIPERFETVFYEALERQYLHAAKSGVIVLGIELRPAATAQGREVREYFLDEARREMTRAENCATNLSQAMEWVIGQQGLEIVAPQTEELTRTVESGCSPADPRLFPPE